MLALGGGTATIAYDVSNRMISWDGPAGVETYRYLGDNKRVWKRAPNGAETVYFYGARGEKLMTYSVTGAPFALNVVSWNVYFAGKMIRADGSAVVHDRLGSVMARSEIAGGGVSRFDYFPYGGEMGAGSAENRDKFGTYSRDQTTGLDYADQRYFVSLAGRFLSSDPYEASGGTAEPGSWNRYPYVGGDPVNRADPGGLMYSCIGTPDGLGENCGQWGWEVYMPLFPSSEGGGSGGGTGCALPGLGSLWMPTVNSTLCGLAFAPLLAQSSTKPTEAREPCNINAGMIDSYIRSHPIYGSYSLPKPFAGSGQALMDAAEAFNVDPSFLVAISFIETHWGYDLRNSTGGVQNNAFGLKGRSGVLPYDSFASAANAAASTVAKVRGAGLGSVESLYSGNSHPRRGEYGGYCTHSGCNDPLTWAKMKQIIMDLGGNPSNSTFRCERVNNQLVMKHGY